MKKVLLTLMVGLGVSGATFASYTYFGPTQFNGSFVNCLGFNWNYCVTHDGLNFTPRSGDLITIYDNDGTAIGTYVLQSYHSDDTLPNDNDPNPQGLTTFQVVAKTASVTEKSH